MRFGCDACGAQYMIADEKVGSKGVKVKCKKCGHIIVVKPTVEASGDGHGATTPDAAAAAPSFQAPSQEQAFAPQAGAEAFGGAGAGMFAQATTQMAAPPADSFNQSSADDGGQQASGAFDSLFGDSGFGSTPAASAVAGHDQPRQSSANGTASAGIKEWYVAIDDSQVGPIDIPEVEQRWKTREIDEDTLAWKSGMADWVPVADIPDLSYLVTDHPHQKASAAQAGMSGSSGVPATLAGATVGPASLGGAAGEEVAWKPSAASALSSLVQEELVASTKPEPQSTPAASSVTAGMDMPSFGSGDLFGAGAAAAHSSPAPAPMAPAFGAPANGGWSVPAGPPKRQSSNGALYAVIGILIVALLGGGIYFAAQSFLPKGGEPEKPVIAQAEKPDEADGKGEKPSEQASNKAADSGAAQVEPKKAVEPTPTPTPPKPAPTPTKPAKPTKTPARPTKTKDKIADVFNDSVKDALTTQDIVDAVKKQGPTVGPCLRDARSNGEIVPGSYKFTLDWTIRPNGTVDSPSLKGPASVMSTSLPACFSRVMRGWKFPPSKKQSPVRNYPFGPITVR